jgi:hypothetical protein
MREKETRQLGAEFPIMQGFLPELAAFLSEAVGLSSGRYNYVVPVESKGAAIFDWVHKPDPINLLAPTILYPRAFDFLGEEDLRGRRVALIDDTCFSGRTLRRLKERLERRGLVVDTFAFAMDETPAEPDDRDEGLRSHTRAAIRLRSPVEYEQYLMELRHWSSEWRIPSSYDHLVFGVKELGEDEVREVLAFLAQYGEVLDYGRRGSYECWTVVFSVPCAWLGPYKEVPPAVPPKYRLWYSPERSRFLFVPMWCPISGQGWENPYHDVIASHAVDAETAMRDALDAISLAGRSCLLGPMFRNFPRFRDSATLETLHLDRTFTERVRSRLKERLYSMIDQWADGAVADMQPTEGHRPLNVPYMSLAFEIRRSLREAYESQRVPRHLRETRGSTVSELLERYPNQESSVHAAVDFLLDFGYATTCFAQTASLSFGRAVRTAEIKEPFSIEKVAAAYVALTSDKFMSSTEAAKLVPLLSGLCRQTVEGCDVKRQLGGLVGVQRYGGDTEDIVDLLRKSTLLRSRARTTSHS